MIVALLCRPSDWLTFHADRVREISHPRGDAGAKAETITAEATARTAPAATREPDAVAATVVDSNIASTAESWFSSPPEPLRSTQAVLHVQRLADKLRGRRRVGVPILHQGPCGERVSFIGGLAAFAL